MATINSLRKDIKEVQQQIRRLELGADALQYCVSVGEDTHNVVDPSQVRVLLEALKKREAELVSQLQDERRKRVLAVYASRGRKEQILQQKLELQFNQHISNGSAIIADHRARFAAQNEVQREKVIEIRDRLAAEQRNAISKLEENISDSECKAAERVRRQREQSAIQAASRTHRAQEVRERVASFQLAKEKARESKRQSMDAGVVQSLSKAIMQTKNPHILTPSKDISRMSAEQNERMIVHASRAETHFAQIAKKCASSFADRSKRHEVKMDEIYKQRQFRQEERLRRIARHEQYVDSMRKQQEIASSTMAVRRQIFRDEKSPPPQLQYARWSSRALNLMNDVCKTIIGEDPLHSLPRGFESAVEREEPTAM